MAEKEDYIVISKKDFDYKKGHYVTHLATQIAFQEAVERMAKEIARKYDPRKPNKEEYKSVWEKELFPGTKKYYIEIADEVLKALLGD